MENDAVSRARARLVAASEGRTDPAVIDAALERARAQVEALAETTAQLEADLPGRIGEAVREGMRIEALPVARSLAEVRGLVGQTVRRLERLEGDLLAERHARVDDLALLVELITTSWTGVDERLGRLEALLDPGSEAARVHLVR
jgi:hypothetical protein